MARIVLQVDLSFICKGNEAHGSINHEFYFYHAQVSSDLPWIRKCDDSVFALNSDGWSPISNKAD